MNLPFRPAFRREYEDELLLELPMRPWELRSGGVGGSAVSAAGVPESYVIRTDRVAALTLRVHESELDAVLAELEEIRASSELFTFAFDQDDVTSEYEVYLHAPVWPDEIRPTRDEEFGEVFLLPIEIRGGPFIFAWGWVEGEVG